jgi:hypothetical protein
MIEVIQINRRRRFLLRLKVINALPKTPPERGIVVEADAVIALWSSLTPMEKKGKTMNEI